MPEHTQKLKRYEVARLKIDGGMVWGAVQWNARQASEIRLVQEETQLMESDGLHRVQFALGGSGSVDGQRCILGLG